jgi:hypothetical protein
MRVVISSGHGQKIRGASGYLDEVNEARRVVDEVAKILVAANVPTKTFHDNTSTTQSTNLSTIVNYHNSQQRDLDVSVHFNAYQTTSKAMGTECLYVSQQSLSASMAAAMAKAGSFINRGPKKRTDLYFLNNTNKPAILLEVCFVDSATDANLYREHFNSICLAIAETIAEREIGTVPPEPGEPVPPTPGEPIPPDYSKPTIKRGSKGPYVLQVQTCLNAAPLDSDFGPITDSYVKEFQKQQGLAVDGIVGPMTWGALNYIYEMPPGTAAYPQLTVSGKVSWFGGPKDTGVAPDEGLAFIYKLETAPSLFLDKQPPGTTGLARRLDPAAHYIAIRWDYSVYPKDMLASGQYLAKVRSPKTGRVFLARPADWGPHTRTNRVADISPKLLEDLGLTTDDQVEVTFPA